MVPETRDFIGIRCSYEHSLTIFYFINSYLEIKVYFQSQSHYAANEPIPLFRNACFIDRQDKKIITICFYRNSKHYAALQKIMLDLILFFGKISIVAAQYMHK